MQYHSKYVGLLCITTVFLQHDFTVSPRIGEIGEIHVKTNVMKISSSFDVPQLSKRDMMSKFARGISEYCNI